MEDPTDKQALGQNVSMSSLRTLSGSVERHLKQLKSAIQRGNQDSAFFEVRALKHDVDNMESLFRRKHSSEYNYDRRVKSP